MQETALTRELRAHRAIHEGCKGCPDYLSIVKKHTAERIVWEGPRGAHTRLSVVEAK